MKILLPILLTLLFSLSGSAFGDLIENESSSLAPKTGGSVFDDLAAQSTKNADSPDVVLGKYDAARFGGQPYNVVAKNNKLTYFELDNCTP